MAVRYPQSNKRSSPPPPPRDELFTRAVQAHSLGRVADALEIYEQLLRQRRTAKLVELAGIACMQMGRYGVAVGYLRESLADDPVNSHVLNNLGVSLRHLGEHEEAADVLRRALAVVPNSPEILSNLGAVLMALGDSTGAVRGYLRALELDPDNANAAANLRSIIEQAAVARQVCEALDGSERNLHWVERELLASARSRLAGYSGAGSDTSASVVPQTAPAVAQRDDKPVAIEALRKVLSLFPENALAWNQLGVQLLEVKDWTQALEAFRRALNLQPSLPSAWNNLGTCYLNLGDHAEARRALEEAQRLDGNLANVQCNLGMLARAEDDVTRAMAHYQRALELDANLFHAHFNLGNLRHDFGDHVGAHAAFERAAAIDPQSAEAAYSVGLTAADPCVAVSHLSRALRLRSDYAEALAARTFHQLRACDWTQIDDRLGQINDMALDPAAPPCAPFWMLAMSDARRTQLSCARKWVRARLSAGQAALSRAQDSAAQRRAGPVRIGLLSGDLRQHAVGELLKDVLPRMDSRRCALYAYDVGPDDCSATRQALLSACSTVRPSASLSTASLARQIADDAIDVLLDLSGFTEHSRSKVLGMRPAPVQVSYLGFPGSMGWDAVDYLLADDYLIPALHESDYDESIVRLPLCYLPARRFTINESAQPTRQDLGLPAQGVVFACFGNPYKLRPQMFECWLRLLQRTPDSVLWFAGLSEGAGQNLRAFARHRGVEPDRMVLSPILPLEQHGARLPLADLFLDTAPYGSGITAAQTLFAGVPLLTMAGQTYVGRMAASLLHALGLDSLIAEDLADYERRALRLAHDADLRRGLRAQLEGAREVSGVFDPDRCAHEFERTLLTLTEARGLRTRRDRLMNLTEQALG